MHTNTREIHSLRARKFLVALAVLVPALLVTSSAGAQLLGDTVTINGFGSWAYGETDNDNLYLSAGPDGEYEHVFSALTFIGKPMEDITVYVQPNFTYLHDELEVELGFAFVDWEIKENLHLRAGRVRHPFGIYTEIFDVGTLRPFLDLPQGVYASKVVARAYNGLGLNGRAFFGDDWSLEYDLYGGQIDLKSVSGGSYVLDDSIHDTIGGRVILNTPVSGLRFGLSAYTGEQDVVEGSLLGEAGTQTVYGVFGEYLANGWSLRSEYTDYEDPQTAAQMAYVELAYMLTDHWQLAGRWDDFDSEKRAADFGLPSFYDRAFFHEDVAVALNYWVNPKFVFKLELHQVEGNRFAGPPDYEMALYLQRLDDKTTAIQFGVDFSF